ncbi:hypothetical protein HanPI659440_Chr00c21g0735071 [Helianthus annuus]|nr:hypothetical protein HanPI659440_Chr00c21g0735071 [Helianthus annuus]
MLKVLCRYSWGDVVLRFHPQYTDCGSCYGVGRIKEQQGVYSVTHRSDLHPQWR